MCLLCRPAFCLKLSARRVNRRIGTRHTQPSYALGTRFQRDLSLADRVESCAVMAARSRSLVQLPPSSGRGLSYAERGSGRAERSCQTRGLCRNGADFILVCSGAISSVLSAMSDLNLSLGFVTALHSLIHLALRVNRLLVHVLAP